MAAKPQAKTSAKTTTKPDHNTSPETATQTAPPQAHEVTAAAIAKHASVQAVGLDLQRAALRLSELGCADHSYAVQKVSMRIARSTPASYA